MVLEKAKIYGMTGSILFSVMTFLVLWFVVLPTSKMQIAEDEGIMVSFGDDMNGGGSGDGGGRDNISEAEVIRETPAEPVAKPETKLKPVVKEIITQNYEQSEAISNQKKIEKQKKEAQNQLLQQQEQQRKAVAAEQKRKQEAIARANNLMGGSFGNGTGTGRGDGSGKGSYGNGTGNGSGNGTADARQGNPAGQGSSGGHGWSLSGRSLVGSLATPSYPSNVEGRVTVNIRVDASGKVSSATVGSNTNISDSQTRNAALNAARNTHFSSGSGVSVGSITYNFKLR